MIVLKFAPQFLPTLLITSIAIAHQLVMGEMVVGGAWMPKPKIAVNDSAKVA